MTGLYKHKFFWQYFLLAFSVLMFVSSFILKRYVINKTSLPRQVEFFERKIQEYVNDFHFVLNDSSLIKHTVEATQNKEDILYLWQKPYFIFLYKDGDKKDFLRFWSTPTVLPPDSILQDKNLTDRFTKLANGYYYILKQRLKQDTAVTAYCLVLIKSAYYIPTDYLKESFPFNKGLDKIVDISLEPTKYPVRSPTGQILFYFKYKPYAELQKDNELSIALRIVGLFLIFLSIYIFLHGKFTRNSVIKDIYLFIGSMMAFRVVLYFFKKAFNFESFSLFDPSIYGSSIFLPDLGDLLINSILFCIISVFVWSRSSDKENVINNLKSAKLKWVIGLVSLMVLVFSTFTIANIIRSLVADSKISFDVSNFFGLSIYTAVGFIILASLSLGFYYFSRFIYRFALSAFKNREYLVYFIISFLGLIYSTFFATSALTAHYLPWLLWLLIYTAFFLNEQRINSIFSLNVTGVIIWIFVFSISISMLMLREIKKKELVQRKIYVEKLATQNDQANERLISIANKYLDTNFFIGNFSRFYGREENAQLRDSMLKGNYIGYLNNYNTSFYFFDSLKRPLYNPTNLSLQSLNTIVDRQSIPTGVQDLYFYETGFDKFSYVTRRQLNYKNGRPIGTVFILSDPKKFSTTSINPELFKQFARWELSNSSVYYYAVYKNKLLITSSKNYSFTSTLLQQEIPVGRYKLKENDGFSELWYHPDAATVVVMARRSEPKLEMITLFSYIFCSFLILLSIIHVFTLLIDLMLNTAFLKKRYLLQPTIRGQIHSTFILITVLSFLVLGIATVSFFINRFKVANRERLGRTMNTMMNEFQNDKDIAKLVFEQRLNIDSGDYSSGLNAIVKRLSDIHGVDLNIYDISGKLLASSNPDVYAKGVLSDRMGPRAYYSLLRLRSIEHIQNEKVSELSYTSIYAPVRDENGAFYAYLGIPYFTSQHELNQEISTFLVTLINLNAFIFLVTGMVALLITNRITRSFRVISNKMKELSLSRQNQKIEWKREDEIGMLVTEYNKMVDKLQASANVMARTEREEAWREMARQVAHEIKNPLTPMKLSLQYLQKAIKEDSPNIEQLTASVSKTLVEQIDHLSKIAADFSQFANINHFELQVMDLHELLRPLEEIYSKNQRVEFKLDMLPGVINIRADRTQMNRLFTNLFVNAIEACQAKPKCLLSVGEVLENDRVIISISDNGGGIPDDMKTKIFMPNFTTKSSGTGLGLAMCKSIVEQAGGTIRFTTEKGIGTTFYVSLPLAGSNTFFRLLAKDKDLKGGK